MHIYGSYLSSKVEQLTNLKEGFIIKGWAEDASCDESSEGLSIAFALWCRIKGEVY